MDKVDFWTKLIDRAIDIVFAKYPARTGLGIIVGLTLSTIVDLFSPTLAQLTFANFSAMAWWSWLPVGILVMHIPTIFGLFNTRSIGNDAVDEVIELIERGNFSDADRRRQYRNLIERIMQNVALSKKTLDEVKSVERTLASAPQDKRE